MNSFSLNVCCKRKLRCWLLIYVNFYACSFLQAESFESAAVVRLYEAFGSHARTRLSSVLPVKNVRR